MAGQTGPAGGISTTGGSVIMEDWLVHQSRANPGRPALFFQGRTWTYEELCQQSEDTARRLAALGVSAGDRVAMLAANSLEAAALFHAVMRLRAVLVPVNVRLTPPEIAWQLADVAPACFIHDVDHAAAAAEAVKDKSSTPRLSLAEVREEPAAPGPLPQTVDLSALHSIIYTSGTTGRPKGVMLTYGNHWWSAIGSLCNLGMVAQDRWLVALPLFHVGGMAILLRSLIYGTAAVIHPRFDAAAVNQSPQREGVTIISLVSTMLRRMLETEPPLQTAGLRAILLGGGPVPDSLLEQARERQLPVLTTYGLTEAASQVTTTSPAAEFPRPGTAGKPLHTARVRIGSIGNPLPAGETGEILVQGPTVMAGYFRQPGATAEVLKDGWLHTGDLGFLDEAGCLHVVNRRHDLIVTGGENVYPAEVEAVLAAHPGVVEAAVVGQPDSQWGELVTAAVVLREEPAPTMDDLLEHCRRRLAGYKVPRHMVRLERLPRGASGKVLREQLQRQLRSGREEGLQ